MLGCTVAPPTAISRGATRLKDVRIDIRSVESGPRAAVPTGSVDDMLRRSIREPNKEPRFSVGQDGKKVCAALHCSATMYPCSLALHPYLPEQFHYFLSHKKQHSVHGMVPAQMAQNLHDSLELLNFSGWFDADALDEISPAAIREGMGECCAVIVLLHDETSVSQWCMSPISIYTLGRGPHQH